MFLETLNENIKKLFKELEEIKLSLPKTPEIEAKPAETPKLTLKSPKTPLIPAITEEIQEKIVVKKNNPKNIIITISDISPENLKILLFFIRNLHDSLIKIEGIE